MNDSIFLCFIAIPIFADAAPGDMTLPWINLIIHGGSFALIVYIVAVLYPKKSIEDRQEREQRDKEHREEREQRDKQHHETVRMLQAEFESRNEKLVSATEKQTASIVTGFKDGLAAAMVEMKSSILTATSAMIKHDH